MTVTAKYSTGYHKRNSEMLMNIITNDKIYKILARQILSHKHMK